MNSKINSNVLYIVALVGVINALSYAVIIPFLYSYSQQFGINAVGTGFLFSAFSLAQFVATPIIGRMSDRYGRKPLLAVSVFGTSISQFLMAIAFNAPMLFFARVLDGVTGGNNSVAQAVISDTVAPKDRAKWFGILGASFGMGFLIGPAIGGILSTFSLRYPFFLGALLALVGTLLIFFFLPETLSKEKREKEDKPLFDIQSLYRVLFEPFVGVMMLASFLTNFAFSIFILGFQAFTNDVLDLPDSQISMLFALFGLVGLIMQGFVVGKAVKKFSEHSLLLFGIVTTSLGFLAMGVSKSLPPFIGASIIVAVGNAFLLPIITSILSKHTKAEDQGGIMGINQSYVSLGTIIGPIVGGLLTVLNSGAAFFGASLALIITFILIFSIFRVQSKKIVDL